MFLFYAGKNSIAQTLKTYKNASNHFEITIPASWLVTKTNPQLKFVAIRPQKAGFQSVPENVNLNIIDAPDANLDAAYNMSIESNSALDGVESIVKKGTAANKQYKWYINTHKDLQTGIAMTTIVFVFFQLHKAFLLTCTASKERYNEFNPIFLKIANSLKIR
ncbi:MAG: hypothetical protein EOP41_06875 [Sphingobacteriaceae bacterium]|nr:MAG: hypothetical protein EOP41_06875 [Sphingobacteriaceae bacterium]